MANHKSAIKRHRQSLKRRDRNRTQRAALRTAIKKTTSLHAAGKSPEAIDSARSAESLIASAATKGLLHPKNAARKVSRMMKSLAKAQVSK